MSYERDKNAHTRGPGAIAAYDRNPARRVRRAQGAKASLRRDRRMIGVMNGLGALSTVTVASETHAAGGDVGGGPHGGGGRVVMATRGVTGVKVAGTTTAPVSGGFNIVGAGPSTSPPPPSCQPGYIYDSKLLQCVIPPGTTTTSGGSSGGGTVTTTGGDGSTSTTIPPPTDTPPPPPPPDDTGIPTDDGSGAPTTVVASSSLDLTTLALIGAAGFAAWYLFLRKKPRGA